MQFKYRLLLVVFSSLALAASVVHAQEDDEDEEEFGTMGFFASAPQSTSVSLKMMQGPKVKFGNLGSVAIALDKTGPNLQYMDGIVNADARRPYGSSNGSAELDSENHVLYPAGGRYQVTYQDVSNNTVTADYLAFQNDRTRDWNYVNPSQAIGKPGFVAFDIYSARTQGQSMEGNRGYSGGVELAVARAFTDPKKRVVFGLSAGLTLTGINISQSGQVNSTLHVYTDYYSTHGATLDQLVSTDADKLLVPGTTYHGPSGMAAGTDGNIKETTVAISATPDTTTDDTNIIDGAKIDGKWKIKGAYFTLKVGPQMVAKLTHSIGLSASVGVAGSYVGTTYTAIESFNVEGVSQTIQLINPETSSQNKFLPGYYANIDATWALNERTGLFAGVSYENLGNYSQSDGVRTAKIDLSATAGVRGGLSIKF